ncbi:hypothetical protein [Nocardioides bruguierae]|uniref:Uncharacterized protein n=1 Tax=Nocardioides bruguierae TaxID=2945102 RepID=A0A9X2IFC7_9ACTN|nr:hypothetical protein [Nocardioides bruguierae]MCM0620948.1 hypothetical protein [Nocardioides bruguierae]
MRRDILISNLVAGGLGLALLVPLGAWPLLLLGVPYVLAASTFLARAYRRETMTIRQATLVWALPGLASALLWAVLLGQIDGFGGPVLVWGAALGTGLYVGWQALALFLRTLMPKRRPVERVQAL